MAQAFSQPKEVKIQRQADTSINVVAPEPSISLSPSVSLTPSVTPSITVSPSVTPSVSKTPSVTVTPSVTRTPSVTVTPSITKTPSITPSISISPTPSPSSNPYYLAAKFNCFEGNCNQYLGDATIYGGGATLIIGNYYISSSPSSFVYQVISQTSLGSAVTVNSTGYNNCKGACLAI